MGRRRALSTLTLNLIVSFALIAGTSAALAADQPSAAAPTPSKEMREKMATIHEQMATCLRSDNAFGECRAQMMKNCGDMMGQKDCPMMGMRMHGRMMSPHPDSK